MWRIGNQSLDSRLFLGSARYPSPQSLHAALAAARPALVTVSLRRHGAAATVPTVFWEGIRACGVPILPNTAGCRTAREAIATARMARELFGTANIKLEVIGEDSWQHPDPFELVIAARELCREGFEVFPYTTADPVVAERLAHAGCRVLMPAGSPIGSGRGIADPAAFAALRARFPECAIVVDAGIGRPSQALGAMEAGADAVLVNTAVALADDPPKMARAFALAVEAGRDAFVAGLMIPRDTAAPSTPRLGIPFREEAR